MTRNEDEVVLFDGLPIDRFATIAGHDSRQLAQNWSTLPDRLEGQFCAARIDLSADSTEVLCDPLGILPVFCGAHHGMRVLSTNASLVASVLGVTDVDRLALASFVALGWAVQRRTFVDRVSALPGGARHVMTPAGVRSTTHYGPSDLARRRRESRRAEDVAQELVDLSTGAGALGPVRCALTAGHDTRVMLGLLRHAGVEARYYTAGEPSSNDIVIGRELAERFELKHEIESPATNGFDWTAATDRFIRQNDGLASLQQLVDYIELDEPPGALDITFWGVGGEIGRAGTGVISNIAPNLPLASRVQRVQERLLKRKIDDQGLLTDAGRDLVADYLAQFVAQRIDEGWPTREVSEAFYTLERVAGWGSTGPRRASGRGDLLSPFCTRAFIDYCFSVSPGERYLEAPHFRLLRILDPELLTHRFEKPFRPQHRALVGAMATRQLWETLRTQQRHGPARTAATNADPPFLDRWLHHHSKSLLSISERAPKAVWDIVDVDKLRTLLTASESTRMGYRDTILRIATPLWLLDPGASRALSTPS